MVKQIDKGHRLANAKLEGRDFSGLLLQWYRLAKAPTLEVFFRDQLQLEGVVAYADFERFMAAEAVPDVPLALHIVGYMPPRLGDKQEILAMVERERMLLPEVASVALPPRAAPEVMAQDIPQAPARNMPKKSASPAAVAADKKERRQELDALDRQFQQEEAAWRELLRQRLKDERIARTAKESRISTRAERGDAPKKKPREERAMNDDVHTGDAALEGRNFSDLLCRWYELAKAPTPEVFFRDHLQLEGVISYEDFCPLMAHKASPGLLLTYYLAMRVPPQLCPAPAFFQSAAEGSNPIIEMSPKTFIQHRDELSNPLKEAMHSPGYILHQWRLRERMSEREVGNIVGKSFSMVWSWEHDKRLPSLTDAQKIAKETPFHTGRLFLYQIVCHHADKIYAYETHWRDQYNAAKALPDRESIAQMLHAWRKMEHLTQQQVASIAGVSPETVKTWENGSSIPRKEHAEKLAEKMLPGDGPIFMDKVKIHQSKHVPGSGTSPEKIEAREASSQKEREAKEDAKRERAIIGRMKYKQRGIVSSHIKREQAHRKYQPEYEVAKKATDKSSVGLMLRAWREMESMSQQQVADIANVSQFMISLWERGKNLPGLIYAGKIAEKMPSGDGLVFFNKVLHQQTENFEENDTWRGKVRDERKGGNHHGL